MKYIVFCLENDITLPNLIKLISKNYNINSTSLKKSDFIKSNNCFIFNNQIIISKILNLKKDFDDIDQVLYFETTPEYLPYFNIIKLTKNFKDTYNFSKNYILPKYFNNPDYDNYYAIEFSMIDYIKNIQENNTFKENIDKLYDINNIISNFDVLQFEPLYVKLFVFSCYNDIEHNEIVNENEASEDFKDFINQIKEKLNIKNDNLYRIVENDNEYTFNKEKTKYYIITSKEINIYLYSSEEGRNFCKDNTGIDIHLDAIVNVHKKYINKFNFNYLSAYDIYDIYNKNDDLVFDGEDWDEIKNLVECDESQESCYVIEGKPNRISFIDIYKSYKNKW